ncbi:diphthine--ammonia ligase [Gottfriedia acidiceleris]|uniref:Dph6-related ATP pyrophosphatase n=1 Tax=Gottfriedia acidiceleris TaxID=371036 RepID=UPI002F26CC41
MNNRKVAVSWSGGKDCCLALDLLIKNKYEVACLVSMVSKKDERNHAHGTPLNFLQMQADAIGIPLVMIDSAGKYEESMINGLKTIKEQFDLSAIAFGTLYVEEDRQWNEQVATNVGLEPIFPVWIEKSETTNLLDQWLKTGYDAIICRAKENIFDSTIVGKSLNKDLKQLFINKEICLMGESGEYHTFVIDGPLFKERLNIVDADTILNSGLWSLNIKEIQTTVK